MTNSEKTGRGKIITDPSMGAKHSGAKKGDLYIYDWGKGEGWSHLSMSTGSGKFAKYGNYRKITGGSGSKMAQHSIDRDGAPWNYGYQKEKNVKVRKKMRTRVIRINP